MLIQIQYQAGLEEDQHNASTFSGSQRGGMGRRLAALKIFGCHSIQRARLIIIEATIKLFKIVSR